MDSNLDDIERLEQALKQFFQTLKRPGRWAMVTHQAKVDLDRPAAMILHTLVLQRPRRLGVQELAQQLGIEPPSVTRKTQELETAGLLRRLPDPQDRRAISLEVTPAGRAVSKRLHSVQRQHLQAALAEWSDADRQQLISLLERFSNNIERIADEPNRH